MTDETATATRTQPQPLTWEQFLAMPESDGGHEFIDGRIRPKMPPTPNHAFIVDNVSDELRRWAKPRRAGRVGPEILFRIRRTPTSRGKLPDLAFVGRERLRQMDGDAAAQDMVPDLAVEVLSPSDRPGEMDDKVEEYLVAGTPMVWVIDPGRREVAIHRRGRDPTVLQVGDTVGGLGELPEFACPVAAFFDDLV